MGLNQKHHFTTMTMHELDQQIMAILVSYRTGDITLPVAMKHLNEAFTNYFTT